MEKNKNLRKLNKFTQEKLAELIDIDVRQVARIEAGASLPSIETLIKISKVLSVPPNDLIFVDKNEQNNIRMSLKSDINDILSLAKEEQLVLIKNLFLLFYNIYFIFCGVLAGHHDLCVCGDEAVRHV